MAGIGIAVIAITADPSPVTPWVLGALIPISLAILGLLWKIQGRISILETQVTPLWSTLQAQIAADLHHPHPESRRMDFLLEKLERLTLTHEETMELKKLAREIADDPKQSLEEREKAETLLYVMPRVIREAAARKS
jgi:hypothetical protein